MNDTIIKPIVYICVIFLGAGLKKRGLFKATDGRVLSKIVMNITLPAAIVASFSSYERDTSLLMLIPIGLLCSSIPLFMMFAFTKNKSVNDRIYYMITMGGYNIGCFGMPVMTCFFGTYGTILCCMFDIGNAVLMVGGSYALTCSLLHLDEGEEKQSISTMLNTLAKRLFSSFPLDIYLLMMVFVLLNIHVPSTVSSLLEPIGNANAFLSMFMIGLMFELTFNKIFLNDIFRLVFLRISFAVCAALIIYFLLPLPLETRQVIAVLVFAPIGTLSSIYVEKCRGDTAKTSCATTVSIIISFAIMIVLSNTIL